MPIKRHKVGLCLGPSYLLPAPSTRIIAQKLLICCPRALAVLQHHVFVIRSSQATDLSSNFKLMFDAALIKYKNKTGEDLQVIWHASELQTCEFVYSVLGMLRDQAKALEPSDNQTLMEWIDSGACTPHLFRTFSKGV